MNKARRVPDYIGHILQAMARIERHIAGVERDLPVLRQQIAALLP